MSKFLVCPECEGEGYVGTLGAFTSDEFDHEFDGAWDYYTALHEMSKEACAFCKGQRVVTAARNAEWNDYVEYAMEREAERRMGC